MKTTKNTIKKPVPLEKDIQNSICEYLEWKDHMFWRQNTSPTIQNSGEKWHFRAMSKYSLKGVPDIILIKDGLFYGLEVKRPKGKQNPDQLEFQRRCEEKKGRYYVVTCIEDVQKLGL